MGVFKKVLKLDSYKKELSAADNKGKLIVVDFHAQWQWEISTDELLLKVLADANDIIVIKVNVNDSAEEIARYEEVSVMPTFKFYKDGNKLEEYQGPTNQSQLEETIDKYK